MHTNSQTGGIPMFLLSRVKVASLLQSVSSSMNVLLNDWCAIILLVSVANN